MLVITVANAAATNNLELQLRSLEGVIWSIAMTIRVSTSDQKNKRAYADLDKETDPNGAIPVINRHVGDLASPCLPSSDALLPLQIELRLCHYAIVERRGRMWNEQGRQSLDILSGEKTAATGEQLRDGRACGDSGLRERSEGLAVGVPGGDSGSVVVTATVVQ
jgi:hypothetical protein